MAAGWNVRVTTFDSKGKPGIVRNFLAYEADKERAIELVRKRVPAHEGELAEAVAEVGADELIGERMRPGDVRQHARHPRRLCDSTKPPSSLSLIVASASDAASVRVAVLTSTHDV